MSDIAFVLGNGESRRGIQIEDLKKHGTVFACNGVYRTVILLPVDIETSSQATFQGCPNLLGVE